MIPSVVTADPLEASAVLLVEVDHVLRAELESKMRAGNTPDCITSRRWAGGFAGWGGGGPTIAVL